MFDESKLFRLVDQPLSTRFPRFKRALLDALVEVLSPAPRRCLLSSGLWSNLHHADSSSFDLVARTLGPESRIFESLDNTVLMVACLQVDSIGFRLVLAEAANVLGDEVFLASLVAHYALAPRLVEQATAIAHSTDCLALGRLLPFLAEPAGRAVLEGATHPLLGSLAVEGFPQAWARELCALADDPALSDAELDTLCTLLADGNVLDPATLVAVARAL